MSKIDAEPVDRELFASHLAPPPLAQEEDVLLNQILRKWEGRPDKNDSQNEQATLEASEIHANALHEARRLARKSLDRSKHIGKSKSAHASSKRIGSQSLNRGDSQLVHKTITIQSPIPGEKWLSSVARSIPAEVEEPWGEHLRDKCSDVRELILCDGPKIKPAGLKFILNSSIFRHLQSLSLANTGLTGQDVQDVCKALNAEPAPPMRILDLAGNHFDSLPANSSEKQTEMSIKTCESLAEILSGRQNISSVSTSLTVVSQLMA